MCSLEDALSFLIITFVLAKQCEMSWISYDDHLLFVFFISTNDRFLNLAYHLLVSWALDGQSKQSRLTEAMRQNRWK